MEAKIVRRSSFQIIGLQFRGNNENNACPKLWDKFAQKVAEVKPLAKEPVTAFGVCSNYDKKNNIFDYTVGLEVNDITNKPNEMVALKIPAQEYALFECTLPTLMQTLKEIDTNWLPSSNYLRSSGPEFELYDKEFDPNIPDSKMYLYIPVLKK